MLQPQKGGQLLSKIKSKNEEDWRILFDAFTQSEELIGMEWGKMELQVNPNKQKNTFSVKHHPQQVKESNLDIMLQSGASTSKKILTNSIDSRKKMLGYDDVLNNKM